MPNPDPVITEEEALANKQIQLDITFDRAEEIKKEVIGNYVEKNQKVSDPQTSLKTGDKRSEDPGKRLKKLDAWKTLPLWLRISFNSIKTWSYFAIMIFAPLSVLTIVLPTEWESVTLVLVNFLFGFWPFLASMILLHPSVIQLVWINKGITQIIYRIVRGGQIHCMR